MLETYRPSGRCAWVIGPLGLFLIIAMAALAWVYQWVLDWIPIPYLTFLATAGFVFVLGFAAAGVVRYAPCRNVLIAAAVGGGAGLAALLAGHGFAYLRWTEDRAVAHTAYMAELHALDSGAEPVTVTTADVRAETSMWGYLTSAAEEGITVKGRRGRGEGMRISGALVWLLWLIEAGLLVGAGLVGGVYAAAKPYCESCARWADKERESVTFSAPPPQELAALTQARSVADLFKVPVTLAKSGPSLVYKRLTCPKCEASYLTITLQQPATKREGEDRKKSKDLFTSVVLSRADAQRMIDLRDRRRYVRAQQRTSVGTAGRGAVALVDDSIPMDDDPGA